MMKEQVVIIIPFYQDKIDYNSQFSLNQCFNVLGHHKIVAIKPSKLDISNAIGNFQFDEVVSFDDKYFKNIAGYNALMLSDEFYGSFLRYEYLLIHQLDVFVFSDQLQFWCNQSYDYIGAPWLYPTSSGINMSNISVYLKSYFYRRYNVHRDGLPNAKQLHNQVGNGGFSLRKVDKFQQLLNRYRDQVSYYLNRPELEFNEDIFWSIEINRRSTQIKKPSYKEAIKFAIETEPQIALELNKGKLPFGCHGWDKNLIFWSSILEDYGYDINQNTAK